MLTKKATKATTTKSAKLKTKIIVKYDSGFENQVYIRGQGGNLSWDKGQLLKNTKPDEWVWETDDQFSNLEFKVLINDKDYETGENQVISYGSSMIYTPQF